MKSLSGAMNNLLMAEELNTSTQYAKLDNLPDQMRLHLCYSFPRWSITVEVRADKQRFSRRRTVHLRVRRP